MTCVCAARRRREEGEMGEAAYTDHELLLTVKMGESLAH